MPRSLSDLAAMTGTSITLTPSVPPALWRSTPPARQGGGPVGRGPGGLTTSAPVPDAARGVEVVPPPRPLAAVDALVPTGCPERLGDQAQGDDVGLAATSWIEPGADVTDVTIRFTGRRNDTAGEEPGDHVTRVERVGRSPADAGRVSVTTKVIAINAGRWPVGPVTAASEGSGSAVRGFTVRIRMAPTLRGPGVRQAAWPVLVLIGAITALVLQALLVRRYHGDWSAALGLSVMALGVGFLAAKVWFLMLERPGLGQFRSAGTCIQGFVLGAAATLVVGAPATGVPLGLLLDASAPGLFLATAIGRPGCFLGGCCAGGPTTSRWGLWSSDRRIGVRRIPVPLIEAGMALAIGLVALTTILRIGQPSPRGTLFIGSLAAYTAGRQLLFPLRGEGRRTSGGRLVTLIAATAMLVFTAVLALAA